MWIRGEEIRLSLKEVGDVKDFIKEWKKQPSFKMVPVENSRDLTSAMGAKFAFKKYIGHDPYKILTIHDYPVIADGVFNGNCYCVRQTDLHCRYLVCNKKNADHPGASVIDIYIHIKGSMPAFEYHGWATRKELIRPENCQKSFGGRVDAIPYSMHESKLNIYQIPNKGE